jgi:hypothetical protein
VTRLGEFSSIGRLFAWGSFLKISGVTQIHGLLLPRFKLWINFDERGLGQILGAFSTNSSGHPARAPYAVPVPKCWETILMQTSTEKGHFI